MERLLAVLIFAALLAALWWFHYKLSDGRMYRPTWLAFGSTFAAALFLVAGFAGYVLDKRTRFFEGASWSDSVIWWEVGVGIALVPVAVYFWRKGAREIDRRLSRTLRSS